MNRYVEINIEQHQDEPWWSPKYHQWPANCCCRQLSLTALIRVCHWLPQTAPTILQTCSTHGPNLQSPRSAGWRCRAHARAFGGTAPEIEVWELNSVTNKLELLQVQSEPEQLTLFPDWFGEQFAFFVDWFSVNWGRIWLVYSTVCTLC